MPEGSPSVGRRSDPQQLGCVSSTDFFCCVWFSNRAVDSQIDIEASPLPQSTEKNGQTKHWLWRGPFAFLFFGDCWAFMIETETDWKGGEREDDTSAAARLSAYVHGADALPGELYLHPKGLLRFYIT